MMLARSLNRFAAASSVRQHAPFTGGRACVSSLVETLAQGASQNSDVLVRRAGVSGLRCVASPYSMRQQQQQHQHQQQKLSQQQAKRSMSSSSEKKSRLPPDGEDENDVDGELSLQEKFQVLLYQTLLLLWVLLYKYEYQIRTYTVVEARTAITTAVVGIRRTALFILYE